MLLEIISKELKKHLTDTDEKLIFSSLEFSKFADVVSTLPFRVKNVSQQTLKEKLERIDFVENVVIANNGFLNITLEKSFLISNLVVKPNQTDKTRVIEYTDPNPFKEFHIGHLMTNAIGESIARISEFLGVKTYRVNYQGDIGLHTAKAVWGLAKLDKTIDIKTLGEAYTLGEKEFNKTQRAKEEIQKLNIDLYKGESEHFGIYKKGRQASLDYFEAIYKLLDTKFDRYFFESHTSKTGLDLVKKSVKLNILKESDGAIIFDGAENNLQTRVFLTGKGLPTYEAKELGLAKEKYALYPDALFSIVTANEILSYMKVVKEVLSKLNKDIAKKTEHITHGVLKLKAGKMSSREGNIISALDLIDEVSKEIRKYNKNISQDIARKISISSIKFWILKQSMKKDIIFDKDKAIAFNGDTGVYILYAKVRLDKILKKRPIKKHIAKFKYGCYSDKEILLILAKFNDVVYRAYKNNEPHLIAQYLLELAHKWNAFYEKNKILNSKDEMMKLNLITVISERLSLCIYLLGMKEVEHI